MKQLISFLVFFLSVFFLSLVSLAIADEKQPPLTIGSILILSGQGASWGNASKNGIDLAIEDINAKGGVLGRKLSAVHQDDQADPKKSLSAFQQLTEFQGVKYIIGPNWSTLGIPLIEKAGQKKVLIISPSLGMAKFNEANEMLFNTWPHDELLSKELARYAFGKGHRNVALVGAEEIWVKEQTKAFRSEFEKLGGKIGYLAEPLPDTADLRAIALKVKQTPGIDAFVSTTDGMLLGSLVAKSLKDLALGLPKYSITVDKQAIDAAHGGFAGLEFLTFLTPTKEFRARYEERYKVPIDIGADSAYDAVQLIALAITMAGSFDTAAAAAELSKIKEYSGMSGKLVADGKRGFTKEYAVVKVP